MDPIEQELRKMAEDANTPQHLKLGALKQLVALMGGDSAATKDGPVVVMAERDDGLPTDPLVADFPPVRDEHGRVGPADPIADLDFASIVGRPPHKLYARVLHVCPFRSLSGPKRRSAEAKTLVDAESRFLREARNRGFDVEADEVADARRRRTLPL